ncbi:MAG: NYN domain-containing protein [Kiritimatiellae bacterium]|nr:NYN domain-containing protein [Kiritimatiellia bacterium]
MTTQQIYRDSRVVHVRELKDKVAELNAALADAVRERDWLRSRFEMAVAAALEADTLPSGGMFIVVDGWNAILNTRLHSLAALEERCKEHLAANARDKVWIVLDGKSEDSTSSAGGRLHVSYTGGEGEQRADRLITAFLRALKFAGRKMPVEVVTDDKKLSDAARKLGATARSAHDFADVR